MSKIMDGARDLHGRLPFLADEKWASVLPEILDLIQRLDERLDRVIDVNELWSGE